MIPKSLRSRVTVVGVVTLALVLGIGAWVTVRALASALRSDTNAQNEEVIDDLAEEILAGTDPRAILVPVGSDGTDFLILNAEGETINASLIPFNVEESPTVVFSTDTPFGDGWEEELTEEEFNELVESGAFDVQFSEGEPVPNPGAVFIDTNQWFQTERVVQSPNDGELTIIAFSPIGIIDRGIGRLAWTLAIIVPLLVLFGGLALWAAIGAALRPVQQISDEAKRIAPSTSGDRLPVPDSGDEIADLTTTLNGMLDRLDAGLIRQRQFVSDASHELRSPLTSVKGAAELVAANPDLPDEARRSVELMQRGTTRLEAVLDDLTQLADGGGALPMAEIDLGDVVLNEVALVRQTADGVSIDTTAVVPAVATAHEVQLGRAVHNLVANAVRHADRHVAVSARADAAGCEITVDDDGPGVPVADRERVFERFVRLDDGRARSSGGSGLGLALVASIAEAHGGAATCTESPLGGARFTLTF